LIVDKHNRTSANFHPLPSGKFALSRTCAGPPEYSGRGGCQLYTHILVVDVAALESVGFRPLSIYRDALALGCFVYQLNPKEVLDPVRLSDIHPGRDADFWVGRARELDLPKPNLILDRLRSGQCVRFAYSGDRTALAECLIGMLPAEATRHCSFATSLVPSSVRPFTLSLVCAELKS
jgi:hypothetical protein